MKALTQKVEVPGRVDVNKNFGCFGVWRGGDRGKGTGVGNFLAVDSDIFQLGKNINMQRKPNFDALT